MTAVLHTNSSFSRTLNPFRTEYTNPNDYPKMSAPNAGRQSPDPETQGDNQKGESGSGSIGAAVSDTKAQEDSDAHKHETLSSNPEGPLEGAAHEKVSKEGRGNV